MTSELRPTVEVWRDASDAATLGSVKYKPAADEAAAAVIEADREAVRAEQAAELAKFKALAETLAGALGGIAPHVNWMPHPHCLTVEQLICEALREYKETRDAS